jgi:hypothetical protein
MALALLQRRRSLQQQQHHLAAAMALADLQCSYYSCSVSGSLALLLDAVCYHPDEKFVAVQLVLCCYLCTDELIAAR